MAHHQNLMKLRRIKSFKTNGVSFLDHPVYDDHDGVVRVVSIAVFGVQAHYITIRCGSYSDSLVFVLQSADSLSRDIVLGYKVHYIGKKTAYSLSNVV